MISALYLVNARGELVIYRLYRDDVSLSAANTFRMQVSAGAVCGGATSVRVCIADLRVCARSLQVIAAKEAGSAAPVRNIEGNSFLYIRHRDMFFVAVSRSNANAGMCVRVCSCRSSRGIGQVHA